MIGNGAENVEASSTDLDIAMKALERSFGSFVEKARMLRSNLHGIFQALQSESMALNTGRKRHVSI